MKNIIFTVAFIFLSFSVQQLSAQEQTTTSAQDDETNTILLEDFETDGRWIPYIGSTHGSAKILNFEGRPKEKTATNYSDGTPSQNSKVLGIRLLYSERLKYTFHLKPISPIEIPEAGTVKSINIWVLGRNVPNTLYVVIKDSEDIPHRIAFKDESGSPYLSFIGWKQLKAVIPNTVQQKYIVYSRRPPIKITSLELDQYSYTTRSGKEYFIYLDDLTAEVDTSTQIKADDDDIPDTWGY